MKGILGVIIGVLVVFLIIWGLTAVGDNTSQMNEGEGRLYFSITDDTADIQSVNEVEMEIEEIAVYSQAEGWTTISSDSKTYALLDLKANGRIELYDSAELAAGAYERVKVTLGNVVVDHETKGRVEAYLPSNEITFNANMQVEEGSESNVTLDFLADQSLHTTVNGDYVFAAVVEVESRSKTEVQVEDNNEVFVSGGTVDSQTTVGVDLDGSVKSNFRLDTSAGLEVDSSITEGVQFMLQGRTYTEGNVSSESSTDDTEDGTSVEGEASTETNVDVDGSGASAESNTQGGINLGY